MLKKNILVICFAIFAVISVPTESYADRASGAKAMKESSFFLTRWFTKKAEDKLVDKIADIAGGGGAKSSVLGAYYSYIFGSAKIALRSMEHINKVHNTTLEDVSGLSYQVDFAVEHSVSVSDYQSAVDSVINTDEADNFSIAGRGVNMEAVVRDKVAKAMFDKYGYSQSTLDSIKNSSK